MPVSNLASYVDTMQAFSEHWTDVNAFLAPKPLTLTNGFTLAMFNTLTQTIRTQTVAVNAAQIEAAQKRSDVTAQKKLLLVELELFRRFVIAEMAFTPYTAGLPTLPNLSTSQSKFLEPFDKAAYLWNQINTNPPDGFTPPLMLPDATLLADFNTMITALQAAYKALAASKNKLSLARKTRDASLPDARFYMKQYRLTVYARLAPGNPLLNNVPRYSPVPGATPKGVENILFPYFAPSNTIKFTFTPSVSKNITRYELRYSPGTKYNPASEQTLATLPATGPYEIDLPLDFVAPGTTALFKIYVFNATGNHRASKVLKVKRTAALSLAEIATQPTALRMAA